MAWDYLLLKKYNATNHFRLLKQLRNEFKSARKNNYINKNAVDNNTYTTFIKDN